MRGLHVFATAILYCTSFARPVYADEKKPLLFFQGSGQKIRLGSSYGEVEFSHERAKIHDRMLAALAKTFGTQIIGREFRGGEDPSTSDLAAACAQTGAIGAVEAFYAFGLGASDTYRAAFTIEIRDCTSGEFFSETGAGVHGIAHVALADVVEPAMEDALASLQSAVERAPNASANYTQFGFFLTDKESDSFWLPDTDGKKTTVLECDPVGTAYRAGLRTSDEVRSINGTPTIGIDVDALNVAMGKAVASGSWSLEVVGKDKTTRTISFQNQTVAWYAAHPAPPVTL